MIFIIILGVSSLIGGIISRKLKHKFDYYSQIPNSAGLTGAQIAKAMLDYYGVHDVHIVPSKGMLTDHYHPVKKTIALSEPVYNQRSIAAASVAAHECGHAIQHATSYPALKMRSMLVPVLKFSSTIQQFLFFGMLFGMGSEFINTTLGLGILTATFGMTALFGLITLPVEFNASNRALAWLEDTGLVQGAEHEGAKDALWWAAMTYVAQALSSFILFVFFFFQSFTSSRRVGP